MELSDQGKRRLQFVTGKVRLLQTGRLVVTIGGQSILGPHIKREDYLKLRKYGQGYKKGRVLHWMFLSLWSDTSFLSKMARVSRDWGSELPGRRLLGVYRLRFVWKGV